MNWTTLGLLMLLLGMSGAQAQVGQMDVVLLEGLEGTIELLPENATTPDQAIKEITLPNSETLLEGADSEHSSNSGLDTANEARLRRLLGLQHAADVRENILANAQANRESFGHATAPGLANLPPPNGPNPPDFPTPPGLP